ncbi:unnamed protein product [Hyaloperonospora brassicae]|uniref:Cation efflux protein cytoplasmic domain-containing protein n=1 Tax=Hyaloperonospora brassicae TaxID=162125 RepID=A0AAV0TKP8_HYABA|nr:unnamed protein product [Hyaloperonospora brassicae]
MRAVLRLHSWSSKRRACVPQYATGVPHKDGSDVCRRLVPFSCRTAHLLCRSAVPASFQLPQLQRCRAPVRRHGHSPGRFLETEERAEQQRMLRQQLSAEDVKAADRITWVGVWLNVALSGLKGAAGVAFHSSGLLADAAHSIGDLVSDCVTLVTLKYCARPPDALQPYGYGKYETIGALSVSLLLVGGSLGILIHSLDSLLVLLEPVSTSTTVADTTQVVALLDHVTVKPMDGAERLAQAGHPHAHGVGLHPAALGIAAVSVVAKEALFRTTFSIGHRVHSSVLIANAWHHRSDAVTSVVALGGIGLSLAGFPLFDPLAGIAVGTIIWKMGVEMGWQRVKELCDAKVPDPVLESIASAVGDVMNASKGEVVGVRRLRCRKVGRHVHADLTVLVDGALPVHEAVKWQQEVKRAIEHKVPPVNDIVVELATNATSAEVREKNAHATRNRHE